MHEAQTYINKKYLKNMLKNKKLGGGVLSLSWGSLPTSLEGV